ncbi:MAG TPA: SUMF1/EgtB/PvdO family nonheme iron enzyme [Candidatus Hydrogenedentes bacterium]|nr:SUMF1/EgtB/PvdO family nonheme iron enzyme [Candidatus Hydrogenedentota bacterium]HPJ99244.1 SUMF1/EgtB/PvdO family nonheme iron enzyme [Candidatus Hydrogenedentota bacterium]
MKKSLQCMPAKLAPAVRVMLVLTVMILCACRGGQYGGALIIETAPEEGAVVVINGEPRGHTPLTIEGLPLGRVLIQVSKTGYRDAMTNAVVPERGREQRVHIEMHPRTGWLTINSQPERARVVLSDGTELGTTPILRRSVPAGQISYTLELEDYEPFSGTITVHEDLLASTSHKLEPKPAQLEVTSVPERAQIIVNKKLQDVVTPATLSLRPGTYVVGLKVKGFVEAERSIELGPNEQETMHFELNVGEAPPGMVLVAGGEFICGVNNAAPDERPQRKVHLEAFFIDKYEVTNEQYQAVVPAHTFPQGREAYPVTGITFQLATAYASAIGKRLPTELEWEKAARGTDGRTYPWGNDFDRKNCNSLSSAVLELREVGQYPAGNSPYGCADMAGNVLEWTSSWYEAYPGNPDVTKDYGQIYKVLRGGSFTSEPFDVRCARRHFDRMDVARKDYGFRCVMDIEAWDARGRR